MKFKMTDNERGVMASIGVTTSLFIIGSLYDIKMAAMVGTVVLSVLFFVMLARGEKK